MQGRRERFSGCFVTRRQSASCRSVFGRPLHLSTNHRKHRKRTTIHEQKPHTPICLHVLRLTTLLVRRRHPQIKRVLWIHWPSFSYISRGSTWILHLDEVAGCHVKTYSMFDKTNWHCSIHLRKKDDFDRLFGWAVPIKIDGFLNPLWNEKLLDLYC